MFARLMRSYFNGVIQKFGCTILSTLYQGIHTSRTAYRLQNGVHVNQQTTFYSFNIIRIHLSYVHTIAVCYTNEMYNVLYRVSCVPFHLNESHSHDDASQTYVSYVYSSLAKLVPTLTAHCASFSFSEWNTFLTIRYSLQYSAYEYSHSITLIRITHRIDSHLLVNMLSVLKPHAIRYARFPVSKHQCFIAIALLH